jgi:hypothetical protein
MAYPSGFLWILQPWNFTTNGTGLAVDYLVLQTVTGTPGIINI